MSCIEKGVSPKKKRKRKSKWAFVKSLEKIIKLLKQDNVVIKTMLLNKIFIKIEKGNGQGKQIEKHMKNQD